jgi:hypothetical protein
MVANELAFAVDEHGLVTTIDRDLHSIQNMSLSKPASESGETMDISMFNSSDHSQASKIIIDVKVKRRNYYYLKSLSKSDVKKLRPCDKQWGKKDQKELHDQLQKCLKQKVSEDDEWVTLRETYEPQRDGFPGRLYARNGVQTLMSAFRSTLLESTADVDMSMAMHRVLKLVCNNFDIPSPVLDEYIQGRDGRLQELMDASGMSKDKAKQLFTQIWTNCNYYNQYKRHEFLMRSDKEAKEVQKQLMEVDELKWILPSCKEKNRPGSFIAHLYQWIESKLVLCAHNKLVENGHEVATIIFDGMNLVNGKLDGDKPILALLQDACEEVCTFAASCWPFRFDRAD